MLLPEPVGATERTSRPASIAATTSDCPGLNASSPKTSLSVRSALSIISPECDGISRRNQRRLTGPPAQAGPVAATLMRVAGSATLSDVEGGLAMPLLEAMLTQRAIRRLRPDPLDDAIVLRCIEIALKAPTSSNGQNWEWIVVKDQAVKQKLAAQYRQAWAVYGRVGRRLSRGDASAAKILPAVDWQASPPGQLPFLVVPR